MNLVKIVARPKEGMWPADPYDWVHLLEVMATELGVETSTPRYGLDTVPPSLVVIMCLPEAAPIWRARLEPTCDLEPNRYVKYHRPAIWSGYIQMIPAHTDKLAK